MQAYFQIQCHKQYQEGVHEKALMIAWRLVFGRVVEASRGISFLFCIVISPRDKPSQIGSDVHDREKREFKLAEMQRNTRTEVNVPRSSRSPTIVTRSLALSFSSESIKQHKSISRFAKKKVKQEREENTKPQPLVIWQHNTIKTKGESHTRIPQQKPIRRTPKAE